MADRVCTPHQDRFFRSVLICLGALLLTASAWSSQTVITGPEGSGAFGTSLTMLPNGNFVVTDPNYSSPSGAATVGAVYLFSPNGALLSTLTGDTAADHAGNGRVVVLSSGNFLVFSPTWHSSCGAVTWCSGITGVSGTISVANSLVGSTPGDLVGSASMVVPGLAQTGLPGFPFDSTGDVVLLNNGNYVVWSPTWQGGSTSLGAVTWGSGTAGVCGEVSAANSLVGSTSGDGIGNRGVTPLNNGNYVVNSPQWNGPAAEAGAVTWGDGVAGTVGIVSEANSLVGSTAGDLVGDDGVTVLANGNYVVGSDSWSGTAAKVGAVTWGNGNGGTTGPVSEANSLIGSTAKDQVGSGRVTALTNSNYVVASWNWNNSVGAVTWGNGSRGTAGIVSATNSLTGGSPGDQAGGGAVVALTNGNYVVSSPRWSGTAAAVGAVTWGDGTAGTNGVISADNSVVGSTANDQIGTNNYGGNGVVASSNGNYVICSSSWSGTAAQAGAATWGDGRTGISGVISAKNSLVGSTAGDQVGYSGATILPNGNYVVSSPQWSGAGKGAGAATWGNGETGVSGTLSAANSLVGSAVNDQIGSAGIVILANGNYVVASPQWNGGTSGFGAATWGSGTTGVAGTVSATNSLVGSTAGDQVGYFRTTALSNGNYVVCSPNWNGTMGAVTWGDGATGITGAVSPANSLVGSTVGDQVSAGIVALTNGNYVVDSPSWTGAERRVGAVTWGNGSTGTSGAVSVENSLVGMNANDQIGLSSQTAFFYGGYDEVGVIPSSDGNYVVRSVNWDSETEYYGGDGIYLNGDGSYQVSYGAVTLGGGNGGTVGMLNTGNSVLGAVLNGGTSMVYGYNPAGPEFAVGQPEANLVTLKIGPTNETESPMPTLITPAGNAISKSPLAVTFSLPVAAQRGTVQLTFAGEKIVTVTLTEESAGTYTVNINPSAPDADTLNVAFASGTIPDGTYSVTLSYQDAADDATASATSTHVTIDTTAPTIIPPTGGFTGLAFAGPLPDFTAQVTTSDATAVTLTQTPLPGSLPAAGPVEVILTATDAAGNQTICALMATATERPADPVNTEMLVANPRAFNGSMAPGAGSFAGLPGDAKLSQLGMPAIDELGNLAFVAKWTSATGAKGTGIFTETKCVAVLGGNAPITGTKYKTLSDPVISGGHVAFLATLSGTPAAYAAVVMSDAATGTLDVIAQSGETADSDGAVFKSFKEVQVLGNAVGFSAQLAPGSGDPKVTAATSLGLWVKDGNNAMNCLLREGDVVNGKRIKTLVSFNAGAGSPGQGRGWLAAPSGVSMLALALFAGNPVTEAVLGATASGITEYSLAGSATMGPPSLPRATFQSYGTPACNELNGIAFLGTLTSGGTVPKTTARGVFYSADASSYTPLARINYSVPGIGAVFSVLKDPVLAADGSLAFPATIKGGAIFGNSATTLWWQRPNGGLMLLAQGGATSSGVPGVGAAAQWKTFPSLAVASGRGPIFTGKLVSGKGGVTEATANGAWAMDLSGNLRLLFQTGVTQLGGKTLKSFSLLNAVPGSVGVTRSFNNAAQVVWLATYTDGSTAIVETEVP